MTARATAELSSQARGAFVIAAATPLLIGLVVKSWLFRDGEPVIVHYVLTALSLAIVAAIVLLSRSGPLRVGAAVGALLAGAVLWSLFSAIASGIALNIIAVGAFAVLAVGFGLLLPTLVLWSGQESWRLLLYLSGGFTLLSALMLSFTPQLVVDEISGRFAGAFVSVAVACTMFSICAVLALRNAFSAATTGRAALWFGLALLAFALLYLTRTRSSLVECLLGVFAVLTFAPMARGLRMVSLTLVSIAAFVAAFSFTAVNTGLVAIDDELAEFRLEDRALFDARDDNWEFGLERIAARPWLGEGLLAKQTQGGAQAVDFESTTSYDPRYDPHSLAIDLGVRGGIPFMLLMLGLFVFIPARFIRTFGWAAALQSPELILVTLRLAISLFAGGDMTALGNPVDKISWLLLGTLALKTELARRRRALPAPAQPVRAASPLPPPLAVRSRIAMSRLSDQGAQ